MADADPVSLVQYVPSTPRENLAWRAKMRRYALNDPEAQALFRQAAWDDPLFFFQSFLWCLDPRAVDALIPWCLWPHQPAAIMGISNAIDDAQRWQQSVDVVLDKSRAQGGTMVYLGEFLRRWLRDELFMAGLVARTMDEGDSSKPGSLMKRLTWLLSRLPFWMQPKSWNYSPTDHTLINYDKNSSIVVHPSGRNVARGDRFTVFAFDEVASWEEKEAQASRASIQAVTFCRVFVSTHDRDSGLFYDMVFGDNDARKIVLDWKANPAQTKNAFRWVNGFAYSLRDEEQESVKAYMEKDGLKNLRRLQNRGYPVENVVLSPWYIAECLAPGITPRIIAKEYDRNPRGTVGKVFATETLDKMKVDCCRPPVWEGDIILDPDTNLLKMLKKQENGPLKLWFEPSLDDHQAPAGFFAIGADISAGGTGERASNSSAAGMNRETREQIFEFTVFGMMATKFARYVYALANWFNNAYLAWEATGPTGSQFAKVIVQDFGYGNFYERENGKAGWWNRSDADKGELFEGLCVAFEDQDCIPRSEEMIIECGEYEWDGKGAIIHRPSKNLGQGQAHGDRCVAAGVMWLACKDRPMGGAKGVDRLSGICDNAPPYGTFAWRQKQAVDANRRRREEEGGFDDRGDGEFTIADLLQSGGRIESWE